MNITILAFMGCFSTVVAPFDFAEKVVRGEECYPASITTNASGHVLVDFGKHAFGWIETDVAAHGDYVFIWGELLDKSGSVQTNAFYTQKEGRIRCACTCGSFTTDGWSRIPYEVGHDSAFNEEPTGCFGTVMPFRWLEIVKSPFPITAKNIRQVPIHYPYDMSEESFDCDSAALVRVHDFCKHSVRATTYTGKFIDGDRERLPYEADSFITQLSTYAMTSDQTLVRAMADYLATHTTWPTEWKQFFIRIIYNDWLYSGKTDLIEKHYERMKRDKLWLHLRRADGLLVTRGASAKPAPDGEKPEDIVDWAMCYRDGFEMCDVNTVVNALHIRNLREMSEMARAIGRTDDAEDFTRMACQTFSAFQRCLWDDDSGCYRDGEGSSHATVQGNAMALACGAVPPDRIASVADYIEKKGFSCSTYMAQFVLDSLFLAGRDRAAIALMTSDAHRSWLGMMAKGATITPEFWDLTMSEPWRVPDMNHAWSTSPLNVISRFVLGVMPAEPGFARVAVRPQPGDLTRVTGVVPTPRGSVSLDLRRHDRSWRVVLETPVPASFELQGGVRDLPAGRHVFAHESSAGNLLFMNEDAWHFWIADSKNAEHMAREACPPLKAGIDSSKAGLERYIDEIARGKVTHFLMNVNGQRANFPSKVLEPIWMSLDEPERDHEDWVRTLKRLADVGLDPYKVWIDRCRVKGVKPWVSIRMNDLHRTSNPKCPNISKLWRQHPELQLDVANEWDSGFDYSQPLIRDRMLSFIREVLARYDVDGLELDLLRFSRYLPRGRETELAPMFTEFIREISRAVKSSAAARGHSIALSARVFAYPSTSRERGLQVDVWAREGLVDYVMPCNFYANIRDDISADDWRAWIGDKAIVIPGADSGVTENGKRRLATYAEYCKWAEAMRCRGARDGFYLYNLFGHSMNGESWNGILSNGLEQRALRSFPVDEK